MGFYGTEIVLLAFLCSATHDVLDEQNNYRATPATNEASTGVLRQKVRFLPILP